MTDKKLPEIHIAYNRFLDPLAIAYCKTHPRWQGWTPPTPEEVKQKTEIFVDEWNKTEKEVLQGLSDALSLEFQRNVIDVHIVSGIPYSFSNPIVLKSGYDPKDFVDVVTHELVHALLQQNNTIASWDCVNWIKELFPDESSVVRNHLVVHAVLMYLYKDVLGDDERLQKNKERSLAHDTDEYTKAWEIIEEYGYQKFLEDHKAKYSK